MIKTRFAPSPTGHLHVGNLRTALFNFLLALKSQGTFILRLDDTDTERSKQEFIDSIQFDLEWLGIHWTRVERQSKRLELYREAAEKLRQKGQLYECFETQSELALRRKTLLNMGKPPIYDRGALALTEDEREKRRSQTPGYWRYMLNGQRINWVDGIQGAISIDTSSLSDPVLIRADGLCLYTLASVVDDVEMGITDVVRGADHITNTAVQIQLMSQLNHPHPRFVHHSLLTGPRGEPLAKRLGALSIRDLREQGIEPMALLSLLTFSGSRQDLKMGSNLEDLASYFDLPNFSTAPVKFNESDLNDLTSQCLAQMPFSAIKDLLEEYKIPAHLAQNFWHTLRANLNQRKDLHDWWKILRDGAVPLVSKDDLDFVRQAFSLLKSPPYDQETWSQWTKLVSHATSRKGKGLYMPLRKALTGRAQGPEMNNLMPLIQKVTREFEVSDGEPQKD